MSFNTGHGLTEALSRIRVCAEAHADTLDLGGLMLRQVPEEVYQLGWLKRLYLGPDAKARQDPQLLFANGSKNINRCNALSALPEIKRLPRLEELDLAHNRFHDDGARALASLTGLTTLNLTGNVISADGARALASLTGLTHLNLMGNVIGAEGARALASLTNLTTLNLTGSGIGAEGARALASLTGLTALTLTGNGIGAEGARALVALSGLTTLNLSDNSIGDDGIRVLPALSSLTTLTLGTNRIGADGARALAPMTWLRTLSLGGNRISDDGARALASLTGLTALNLGSNGIGVIGARALATMTGLTALNLGSNKVGADGARALGSLTGLTTLNLSNSIIGDSGARALAALNGLTTLDLGVNSIGDGGVRALTALTGLTTLNLATNNILADGARALGAMINLTTLKLSANRIGEGARALAALTNLTTLTLAGNGVDDDGAIGLATLTRLTNLNLAHNKISAKGVRALATLTGITSLSLAGNAIGDDGASALAALSNLTFLDLANNHITDLSPLYALAPLSSIDLSHNEIAQPHPEFWLLPSLRDAKLHEAKLGDVPTEVLSRNDRDNCLPRLQAHFRDLGYAIPNSSGDQPGRVPTEQLVSDVKVLVLGNGRIGKTQICRRLRGEPFVENDTSTHGVVVRTASLPGAGTEMPETLLHLWDFGGQDLYLSTHALFLRSRAIVPIVWTPRTEQGTHDWGGYESENFPLTYWARYVRQREGVDTPLILVQSLWPKDRQLSPRIDADDLNAFEQHNGVAYSPLTDRHRDRLESTLREAVEHVHAKGIPKIGGGRAWVKQQLEARRERAVSARSAGQADPALALMSRAEFEMLCREPGCVSAGGVSDPAALLDFLDAIGTVFAFKGTSENRIIVDLEWALSAIYAVFDRTEPESGQASLCRYITEIRAGRFTPAELGEFRWNKDRHPQDVQALFIDMMLACGIAFPLYANERGSAFAEFVAPDLLPPQAAVQDRLNELWDADAVGEPAVFAYNLLPPGLLRAVMVAVGAEAGFRAEYWRDGFYVYDNTTRSRAVVMQHRDSKNWSGRIEVSTQGGDSGSLLVTLSRLVSEHQDRLGIGDNEGVYAIRGGIAGLFDRLSPRRARLAKAAAETKARLASDMVSHPDTSANGDDSDRVIGRLEPAAAPEHPDAVYMSYAWGEDLPEADPADRLREQAADAIFKTLKQAGRRVIRDRNRMKIGYRISDYMEQLADGQLVLIILSKRYLQSPYCMYELFRIYQKAEAERDWVTALQSRTQVWKLPCAEGCFGEGRFRYSDYWSKVVETYKARKEADLAMNRDTIGKYGDHEFRLARHYTDSLSDILFVLGDVLGPSVRTIDDIEKAAAVT